MHATANRTKGYANYFLELGLWSHGHLSPRPLLTSRDNPTSTQQLCAHCLSRKWKRGFIFLSYLLTLLKCRGFCGGCRDFSRQSAVPGMCVSREHERPQGTKHLPCFLCHSFFLSSCLVLNISHAFVHTHIFNHLTSTDAHSSSKLKISQV